MLAAKIGALAATAVSPKMQTTTNLGQVGYKASDLTSDQFADNAEHQARAYYYDRGHGWALCALTRFLQSRASVLGAHSNSVAAENRFARRRASGEVLNLSSAGALTQREAMLRSECWQFASACKARCANDDAYSCLARVQERRANQ